MENHNSAPLAKSAASTRDPRKEPYLEKRGSVFWFVRVVPKDIRDKIGFDCWRISLRTDSFSLAREKCRAEAVRTDGVIRDARAPTPMDEARRRLEFLSDKEKGKVAAAGGLDQFMKEVGALFVYESWARMSAALTAKESENGSMIGRAALASEKASAWACARVMNAALKENYAILMQLGIEPNGEPRKQSSSSIDESSASNSVPQSLADEDKDNPWVDDYMKKMIEAKSVGPEYKKQLLVCARRFGEVNGRLRIKVVTRKHVEAFCDAMESLPYRSELVKHHKGNLRVKAAVAFGKENGLNIITKDAAQKQLDGINSLLNFAVTEGRLSGNPGFGVKVYKKKEPFSLKKKEKRVSFSVYELSMINEAVEAGWGDDPERLDDLWLYRTLLYSGARPEEIAQVETSDIYELDGVWVIRVRDGAGEDGFNLKIKNQYSLREIPIHPRLIEMGFLEFARSAKGPRIFASFSQDRFRMSGATSRRFHYILRKKVGICDRHKVFYSLRHTFTTAMRNAGITTYVQMLIQGHGQDDEKTKERGDGRGSAIHDGYGEEVTIRVLQAAISRVDPFKLPSTDAEIAAVAFSRKRSSVSRQLPL